MPRYLVECEFQQPLDDAPSPGAVRQVAELYGPPVGRVTQVSVLNPSTCGA